MWSEKYREVVQSPYSKDEESGVSNDAFALSMMRPFRVS
jgi:hypothetical protein